MGLLVRNLLPAPQGGWGCSAAHSGNGVTGATGQPACPREGEVLQRVKALQGPDTRDPRSLLPWCLKLNKEAGLSSHP